MEHRGDFHLIDLANDFFIARFIAKEDRDWALEGSPWIVQGHYLTVREWCPNFQHYEASLERVPIWVHIPNLPMKFQHDAVL